VSSAAGRDRVPVAVAGNGAAARDVARWRCGRCPSLAADPACCTGHKYVKMFCGARVPLSALLASRARWRWCVVGCVGVLSCLAAAGVSCPSRQLSALKLCR
jgi:hypothetical protein